MAAEAEDLASLETMLKIMREQNDRLSEMLDSPASASDSELRHENSSVEQWSPALAVVGAVFLVHRFVFRLVPFVYRMLVMHVVCACCGPLINLNHFGTWAVVTGCTDGIGKAYAEKLARMGLNLVLISRNLNKLQQQAQGIGERMGVLTRIIVANFSQPDVYGKIAIQLDGLDIGILVNNVGMGMDPEFFLDVPEKMEMMSAMINCNVFSVTMMTALVLPSMVAKKKGAVINVASAAGCRPVPLMALYSSTKAMIIHLTKALHQEYSEQGIVFQAVTPFLVSTKMTNMEEPTGIVIPTPQVYVDHAVRILGVSTVTPAYFWHDLQYLMVCLMPDIVVKRALMAFKTVAEKQGKRTVHHQQQRQRQRINV